MAEGPEFDRIRGIVEALGDAAGGLGDDSGEIPAGDGTLVASTDASVEHVHFQRDWLSAEEIGWRSAAAALSDISAQGAMPVAILTALALPATTPESEISGVMRGVGAVARAAGAKVVGGDLVRARDWTVTVTVLGRAVRPVLRSGASPGDRLWVTGTLGGARAALDAWLDGRVPPDGARQVFAHPPLRVEAGRWLAAHGATAMLDLSDGLAADVRHLAAASDVSATLTLERVPVQPDAAAAAFAAATDAALYAARGGEDYELLVAMPPAFGDAGVREFEHATGHGITQVGTVERGSGVRLLLRGERIRATGFDHFR
ncbi:MAG TPA: thiamine-phosphate kinase [Gemmatimonadales bacterium]|nr:thiamine-phosphate kinase [Gemmatimonadales bacterium]